MNCKTEDPMDTPLPCDVTVGHVTHRRGVTLRSLVARMGVLYAMAHSEQGRPTGAASGIDFDQWFESEGFSDEHRAVLKMAWDAALANAQVEA